MDDPCDFPDWLLNFSPAETGCLRWQGPLHGRGYGLYKRKLVHRLVIEYFNGPIPPGMTVDHVWTKGCRYKDCMAPHHLEVVTGAENSRRMHAVHTSEETCRKGHPREGNTYISPAGQRSCRVCTRASVKRWQTDNRERYRQQMRESYDRRKTVRT